MNELDNELEEIRKQAVSNFSEKLDRERRSRYPLLYREKEPLLDSLGSDERLLKDAYLADEKAREEARRFPWQ